MSLFAPCESGLEEVLCDELNALGAVDARIGRRGVSFRGTRELMWRANIQSRVANRVLVEIARCRARSRDELYDAAARIPLSDWMGPDQTLAVDARVARDSVPVQLVNQVVKDAICDRFRRESGRRPSVDRTAPDIPIAVHITRDGSATISLDSSGARLHRRGYRKQGGAAPLRETLAAGILLLTGWDGTTPLVDPMCGSGTFVIEAALLACRYPPGLLRLRRGGEGFAFQRWLTHDGDAFHKVVDRLRDRTFKAPQVPILGSDIDGGILKHARRNAARAHVADAIAFERGDVAQASVADGGAGVLLTNPPYGERIGEPEALIEVYKSLGDTMKQRFAGYTAWVLAGDRAVVRNIGLKAARRVPLYNGAIECRLLRFDLW